MEAVLLQECVTALLAVSRVENVSLAMSQIPAAQLEIACVSIKNLAMPPAPAPCLNSSMHMHSHIYTHMHTQNSLSAVITISFEQESYAVVEGSSQQLQVCAHTTDRIKREQHLTVNAVITQAVGATQGTTIMQSLRLTFKQLTKLMTLGQFNRTFRFLD